jgi:phage portal protein BeeE
LSDSAKTKILTAFGLDESIVGDTSGRTYANAEQAWENFWLLDPMPAHMRMVSNGWARLPGLDDLRPGFDTDEVEPLRRAKAAKLEQARAEVAAGVRTIKSYADLAGYGDEIEDTPQTRALWMAAGLTPIASREADKEALAPPAGPPTAPGQAPG